MRTTPSQFDLLALACHEAVAELLLTFLLDSRQESISDADAVRRLDQAALAQARVVSDSTANVENARDTLSRALPGGSRRPGSILADGPMATRS